MMRLLFDERQVDRPLACHLRADCKECSSRKSPISTLLGHVEGCSGVTAGVIEQGGPART